MGHCWQPREYPSAAYRGPGRFVCGVSRRGRKRGLFCAILPASVQYVGRLGMAVCSFRKLLRTPGKECSMCEAVKSESNVTKCDHWLTVDESRFVMCLGDHENLAAIAKDSRGVGFTGGVWDFSPQTENGTPPTTVYAMSRDAALLVVGKEMRLSQRPYQMLALWDVKHGRKSHELELLPLDGPDAAVLWAACFSADSATIAVESSQQVSLLDVATGRERSTLRYAQLPVFVQGGHALAALRPHPIDQWCVKLYDSLTGTEKAELYTGSLDCSVRNLQCSPDGKTLVVSASYTSKPNSIPTWAARWTWLRRVAEILQRPVSNAATLKLFDTVTGQELAVLPPARCHWFSPDGKLFATKRTDEARIRVWDVPPRKPWTLFALLSASLVMTTATLGQCWPGSRWRDRPRQNRPSFAGVSASRATGLPWPSFLPRTLRPRGWRCRSAVGSHSSKPEPHARQRA